MLYIFAALKPEAQSFVDKYRLKKVKQDKYTLFLNNEMTLIISGMGVENAKVAVKFIVNNFNITQNDIFLNIGICAADRNHSVGELIKIDSIIYKEKNVTLYSNSLNTIVCLDKEESKEKYEIADMESYGFYEALKESGISDNIHIYKVVSDHFEPDKVTKEATKLLLFNVLDRVNKIIYKEEV